MPFVQLSLVLRLERNRGKRVCETCTRARGEEKARDKRRRTRPSICVPLLVENRGCCWSAGSRSAGPFPFNLLACHIGEEMKRERAKGRTGTEIMGRRLQAAATTVSRFILAFDATIDLLKTAHCVSKDSLSSFSLALSSPDCLTLSDRLLLPGHKQQGHETAACDLPLYDLPSISLPCIHM